MRHCYIRGILAVIWVAAAVVCAVAGNFTMTGLYALIGAVFFYSAYAMWKKNEKGDR